MRRRFWFVAVMLSLCADLNAEPRLWGHLHSGQHAVGFRTLRIKTASAELHVWYPALSSQGGKVNLGDYLRLSQDLKGAEPGFRRDSAALRKTLRVAVMGRDGPLDDKLCDEILAMPSAAVRNAMPASGKFPLIVLDAPLRATTAAQSVLSEYLASHGFVVAYAPESISPPMPDELKSAADKAREFSRLQLRLQRALSFARQMPNVQPDKVAVLAWSYAGESAFGLQQSEPSVRLVVGLSTNVLDHWVYREDHLAGLKGSQLTVPYVLLDGEKKTRPEVMAKAAARTFSIHIKGMSHGSFNVLEGMLPSALGIQTAPEWSNAGPQQQLGYEVAAQYVLRSCEHYLKAIPTLDTPYRLWDPDGDVPPDFVTLEEGGSAPAPPPQPRFSTIEFSSLDQLKVTADLYTTGDKHAPTIVLVHQSGASRGEYRQIAPYLQELGFNALAVDSRWGERDRWNGVINETAARFGTVAIAASSNGSKIRAVHQAAAQDIRAALEWLNANDYTGAKLLWGSSISANLVLKVAADPTQRVVAVLAFSPGEYYKDQPNDLRSAIASLQLPTLIACGADEEDTAKPVFDAVPSKQKVFYRAIDGRHGASILVDDPGNWVGITPFLAQFERTRKDKSAARTPHSQRVPLPVLQ
jgi:dienelactone hydrolase